MRIIEGLGASDGVACGMAHWVRNQDDLGNLPTGGVLLARMTSPDWGAAYQQAAAVVTVEGGILCHAAIVAREEGIPAVVGVGMELESVANGTCVRVDGSGGIVEVGEA